MTDLQRLTREIDTLLAARLPAALYPLLLPAAGLIRDAEWSSTSDTGRPACPDCGRTQAYGSHVCSCPTRQVLHRLRTLLRQEAYADRAS